MLPKEHWFKRDEYFSIYPYGFKKERKENRNLISRPPCVAGGIVRASKVLGEELRSRYEQSVSWMSIITSTRKNCWFFNCNFALRKEQKNKRVQQKQFEIGCRSSKIIVTKGSQKQIKGFENRNEGIYRTFVKFELTHLAITLSILNCSRFFNEVSENGLWNLTNQCTAVLLYCSLFSVNREKRVIFQIFWSRSY